MTETLDVQKLFSRYGETHPAGHTIFREGETSDAMYFVVEGRVRIEKAAGHKTMALAEFGPGEFFGEMAVLMQAPRSATAQTVEPTKVIKLGREAFMESISAVPNLSVLILKRMAQRLKATTEKLAGEDEPTGEATAAVEPEGGAPAAPSGAPDKKDRKTFWFKEVNCLVCGKSFFTRNLRRKAYEFKGYDTDFFPKYEKGNPLLYAVWVCPYCFYAEYATDFNRLNKWTVTTLKKKYRAPLELTRNADFAAERTLEVALKAYKLALLCSQVRGARKHKLAGIHQRIAWLHRMAGNPQEEREHMEKAAALFAEAVEREHVEDTWLGTAGTYYLVGEIQLRLGNLSEALRWFGHAVSDPSIKEKAMIWRMAEDELQATRKELAKQKAAKSATAEEPAG